jgi:hypothetical protein
MSSFLSLWLLSSSVKYIWLSLIIITLTLATINNQTNAKLAFSKKSQLAYQEVFRLLESDHSLALYSLFKQTLTGKIELELKISSNCYFILLLIDPVYSNLFIRLKTIFSYFYSFVFKHTGKNFSRNSSRTIDYLYNKLYTALDSSILSILNSIQKVTGSKTYIPVKKQNQSQCIQILNKQHVYDRL